MTMSDPVVESKLKTYKECKAIWAKQPKLNGLLTWMGVAFTTFKKTLC